MNETWIPIGSLPEGTFAITKVNGFPILSVSRRSFRPSEEGYAQAVHIANGIGAFLEKDLCRRVTAAEAFAAVRTENLYYDGGEDD